MAEDQSLDLGESKKPSKLKYIIGGIVLLLLINGAVLYYLGVFSKEESTETASEDIDSTEEASKGEAFYHSLDPAFVVNFPKTSGARLLQISVSVLSYDEDVVTALEKHAPMIRNNLLLLFGAADPKEIRTAAGKDDLRVKVRESIQQVLEQQIGNTSIDEVFFTGLVMQ